MKISCSKKDLQSILGTSLRISGTQKGTHPILNNILLKAQGGVLETTITDLTLMVWSQINATVEEPGEITVPASLFGSFVNNLGAQTLEMESKDNSLTIKADKNKVKLSTLPASDFPEIKKFVEVNSCLVDQETLKNALTQIIGLASTSESRPELSGILFQFNNDKLKIVATDTFRIGERIVNSDAKFVEEVIVPAATATEVVRIIGEKPVLTNQKVKIILDETKRIIFEIVNSVVASRVIDGQYPNYQQIIPKELKFNAEIDRGEFKNAVKLASLVSGKSSTIMVVFDGENKQVEVAATDASGSNQSFIRTEMNGAEKTTIGFNWKFLSDGLENIENKKALIEFNDSATPVIIRDLDDAAYLYLVMPIKISLDKPAEE